MMSPHAVGDDAFGALAQLGVEILGAQGLGRSGMRMHWLSPI
ncbi:hypothetical protein CEV32_4566 [Brucella rhizosphaerae]|uniref:Uncharacterized protein n=1 Tax=Brucella rhizosphaerae TaxID=571254 RepID=A0A256FKB0_9HYPH|nr:hypothetical protein CEV32_4566 [Brucella rhizosphaerae]